MKLRWIAFAVPALLLLATGSPQIAHAAPQGPPPGYQGPPPPDQGGWDIPPQEFRDVQRQGFHDGVEGARKDFENHRSPDVRNRDEFRHPHVPRGLRNDYREGFRRGYDAGVRHLYRPGY